MADVVRRMVEAKKEGFRAMCCLVRIDPAVMHPSLIRCRVNIEFEANAGLGKIKAWQGE